jgi:hypothetical protein
MTKYYYWKHISFYRFGLTDSENNKMLQKRIGCLRVKGLEDLKKKT